MNPHQPADSSAPDRNDLSIKILENGDEIFPAMLDAIRGAKHYIYLVTYVYWKGEIAREFAEVLAQKAAAGVKTYLLLDAHGSHRMSNRLKDHMSELGVMIGSYNPFRLSAPLQYQHRTHRKILVCDGKTGFLGGAGIAGEWCGSASGPDEWHDFHFQTWGKTVQHLERAFIQNWNSEWTVSPRSEEPLPDLREPDIPSCEQSETEFASGTITPILSSPQQKSSDALDAYRSLLSSAEKSVKITTAYLIPDKEIKSLLRSCVERGVKVEIIIPGKHHDSRLAQASSRAHWSELIDSGVELHQYQPTMCHAKVVIIDGTLVSVGSINFDLISLKLNEEANIVVNSREFASSMEAKFKSDKERCVEVTRAQLQNRSLYRRLEESVATRFPLPYWKRSSNY